MPQIEKNTAVTPDKKKLLIGQVELEIENLNKALREGGLPAGVFESVKSNRDTLQKVLNQLFEKRGVIPPKQTNETLDAIEKAKASRMQQDLKRNLKRIAIYAALGVALWVGYKLYTKSKAN